MERPWFLRNLGSLPLCLLLLMAVSLSCTMVKGIAGLNEQSKELNDFYYNIPFGFENAEPDPGAWLESSFMILMPDSERIFVGKLDSEPVNIATLGESVKAFAAEQPPDKRVVYIAAAEDVSREAFARVLDELRKQEIDKVELLISSAERRKDISGDDTIYKESMGDIPPPDLVFEVKLREANNDESSDALAFRPNPLMLVITARTNGQLRLNQEPHENEEQLGDKLSEIFKRREVEGVFRENSNEVEKTVYFPLTSRDPLSPGDDLNYGQIITWMHKRSRSISHIT